ncbi:hypothetical protein [Streptomyces blattellae]|uniref:hypothetical protein n=1 Tax=Streptomyces blattellae TaxID=2569855 RepID=UPI0018ACABCF|nr:hypothetical protein [Streptomyces blattellae]
MPKTGPQRYPGASTAYWYQNAYPGSAMESNVVVWHTTEGRSLPAYGGGSSAPTFTAVPDFAAKKLKWFQHFDFDTSARALVNKAGGVETNTLNAVQVEIVGTCDPATHKKWGNTPHLYTPELPAWAVRDLAAFAKWAHEQHRVPLTSKVTFKAYPGSYGTGNGVRMSNTKWQSFTGHCGHQHVPENLHGDPGAFPMAAILNAAKAGTPKEADVADLTTDDIRKIWLTDGIVKNPNPATADANPHIAPATGLRNIEIVARRTESKVDALAALVAKLVEQKES